MLLVARAAPLALLFFAGLARGQDRPSIEVRADRMEGDLELRDVQLSGGVSVSAGPARLTADRLRLRKLEDGSFDVTGPAALALCPCREPPVDFTFDRANVDPGGGATLHGAALRIGGREVLPVPWLALRSERQLGLLAPTVSYRGRDGLLAGAGVHAPLWGRAWVDVTPSAYFTGGAEVVGRLHMEGADLRARWDHKGGDLLALDGRVDVPLGPGSLAGDLDAIRGGRGRIGTLEIDPASRVYDRGGIYLVSGEGFQTGVRGIAPRAATGALAGPRISFVMGGAPARGLDVSGVADATSLAGAAGEAFHLARADAEVGGAAHAGIVKLSARSRAGAVVASRPDGGGGDLSLAGVVAASVPLAKRLDDGALFQLEPRVFASAVGVSTSGVLLDPLGRALEAGAGRAVLPGAGIETRGPWVAATADGAALITDDAPRSVARGTVRTFARSFVADAEVAVLLRDGHADGAVVVGSAEAGDPDGLRIAAGIAGRRGADPFVARALAAPSLPAFGGGTLSTEGWSAHGTAAIPLLRPLSLIGTLVGDLTNRELLAERGTLAYRHPCGCLAASAVVGHRVGREGIDAGVTLDLAPR